MAAIAGVTAIRRQRFDGGDEPAFGAGDADLAGTPRFAVHVDGAGPAIAGATAIFGAGEVGRIAQRPEERRVRVHAVMDGTVVDGEFGHRAWA